MSIVYFFCSYLQFFFSFQFGWLPRRCTYFISFDTLFDLLRATIEFQTSCMKTYEAASELFGFVVSFEERKSYISIQFPTIAQSLRIFLIVLEASVLTQVAKKHKNKLYSREKAQKLWKHIWIEAPSTLQSHIENMKPSPSWICVYEYFYVFLAISALFLFHFEIRQLEIIASIISIVFEFECRLSKNYLIPSSMAFYARKCDITPNTLKCAFCQTQLNSLDIFLWVFSVSTFNLSHDRDVNEAGKETMINEKRELWNILFFGLVFQRWDTATTWKRVR